MTAETSKLTEDPSHPSKDDDSSNATDATSDVPPNTKSEPSFDLGVYESFMESVVKVTLSGFGGSLIGLSQEKRLESVRVVTGAAAAASARKRRSPSAPLSNLPLTWAISCAAFCSILETCHLTSPATIIYDMLNNSERPGSPPSLNPYVQTVCDYTIGGALAGIAGSFGRNEHIRRRIPSAMFKGPKRFFGLAPGIALGALAGVLQASTDYGVTYAESMQQRQQQQTKHASDE